MIATRDNTLYDRYKKTTFLSQYMPYYQEARWNQGIWDAETNDVMKPIKKFTSIDIFLLKQKNNREK